MRTPPDKRNPVARAGAHRVVVDNRDAASFDSTKNTETGRLTQDIAAAIIARRYHLTPCLARVVCELAQLGRFA